MATNHAYPFCETTPGTFTPFENHVRQLVIQMQQSQKFAKLAINLSYFCDHVLSVKLAKIGHKNIWSVKVGVHHSKQFDNMADTVSREHSQQGYHCTVDLLFDWFGFYQTSKADSTYGKKLNTSKINRRSTVQ